MITLICIGVKLDIFNGLDSFAICKNYKKEPLCSDDFFIAQPVYEDVVGWKNSKNSDETFNFIKIISELTDRRVEYISCGTDKKDLIKI